MAEKVANFFTDFKLLFLLIAVYKVQSVQESFNITALFPVNSTKIPKESEEVIKITDKYAHDSNEIEKSQENKEKPTTDNLKSAKTETTTWKVDAVLTVPKEEVKEIVSKSKEFKPSQQLESFYDEGAVVVPTGKSLGSFTPVKGSSSFISYGNHFSRRADKRLPDISERCKRRLLCEIHSEKHYYRLVQAIYSVLEKHMKHEHAMTFTMNVMKLDEARESKTILPGLSGIVLLLQYRPTLGKRRQLFDIMLLYDMFNNKFDCPQLLRCITFNSPPRQGLKYLTARIL
ncbi:unnamed protein product [Pieris macdunnoughi]|uniref:Uncharacterized protein n=1 Tax=Pieris macdunnoughi TaxID=345717 RepID=A0A821QVH2_9NEOP|nr:unnamed protein product [Pieris macdunnoughi]